MGIVGRLAARFAASGKPNAKNILSQLMASTATTWGRGGTIDAREALDHFIGWQYAAVHRLASIAATNLPLAGTRRETVNQFQAHRPESRIVPVKRTHPLQELIHNPNGPQTGIGLWYQVFCNLFSAGSAPIFIVRDAEGPIELWSLPAFTVRPFTDGTDIVTHYDVSFGMFGGNAGQGSFRIDAADMIVVNWPSMMNPLRANNPTKLMAQTIDLAEATLNARCFGMHNGVHISSVIEIPDAYDANNVDLRRLLQRIQAEHAGPYGTDRPVALPPGAKLNDISAAREASYANTAKETRNEVMAIYGAVPTLMGFIEDANQSIVNASLYQTYVTVIKPYTAILSASLTEKLASQYSDDLEIVFPYMVPDDRGELRADLEMLARSNAVSVDELRSYGGLDPLGGVYSKPMQPMGMAPMDDLPADDDGPPQSENGFGSVGEGFASHVGKSAAFDESKHPRAEDGRFGTKPGRHAGKPQAGKPEADGGKPKTRTQAKPESDKVKRAKAAHVMVNKEIQRYAEEHNEPKLAKALRGLSYPDSEPVDVAIPGPNGVLKHGLEVKTLVKNGNGKITMDTYSQVRKIEWERRQKATYHTVILDDHAVFNAGGDGKHDEGKRVYYYRRGVAGSARISSMHKCKNLAEVKKLMEMPEAELPLAAQRTDGKLRVGQWKPAKDGSGYENSKTGQVVRPKK